MHYLNLGITSHKDGILGPDQREEINMPTQHHVTRSTMITEIDYDSEKKLLTLTFGKGGKYEYQDVPETVYQDLLNAESIGKKFLAEIKGKYPTERI